MISYFRSKVLILLGSYVFSLSGNVNCLDWDVIKSEMCEKEQKMFSSQNSRGSPRTLYVGFNIADLYDVDENLMEFSLQIRLYQVWPDQMLNQSIFDRNPPRVTLMPESLALCFWQPDLFFLNSKESRLFTDTVTNIFYKYVHPGFIYKFSRYHLVVSCPMRFYNYPMDSQHCELRILSLGYSDLELTLDWLGEKGTPEFFSRNKGIGMDGNLKPLKFNMAPVSKHKDIHYGTSGNFTELVACFSFHRRLAAFLVNTYLPSLMVVCLSWVSFWLDPDAVPGRVTLGVTAILTLATQIVYVRGALPALDYMTAMDVWLFGCLLLVFLSLIEFTLANYSTRRKKLAISEVKTTTWLVSKLPWSLKRLFRSNSNTAVHQTSDECNQLEIRKNEIVSETTRLPNERSLTDLMEQLIEIQSKLLTKIDSPKETLEKSDNFIDRFSRIAFPSAALLFTFTYAVFYLNRSD